jgi:hypothetical protein
LRRSKWIAIGTEKFEIATGALVEQEIYLGEIIFDSRRGPVYAVSTEAQDILIGTKLLGGKTLVVNFPDQAGDTQINNLCRGKKMNPCMPLG